MLSAHELRSHGIDSSGSFAGGIEVHFVGAASDAVVGDPSGYNLWQVQIGGNLTGSGFPERFMFVEPIPRPTVPTPMLVVDHRFGKTDLDILVGTDYVAAAAARGWFAFAPLSASNKHFMSDAAHVNQEFALDWIVASETHIDPLRIYGVGFSMGGGMVMNYAARHQDPSGVMFAAVVNHTGDISLGHVYQFEIPAVKEIFEFWYPGTLPFAVSDLGLQRASLIHYDRTNQTFKRVDDMARNIAWVPKMMVRASNDTIAPLGVPYLAIQNDELDHHFRTYLGVVPGPDYQYVVYPYTGHDWDMLPEETVLDFVEQFTLVLPTQGRVLADRNARWVHFTTTAVDKALNVEFDWALDLPNNALAIEDTVNLSALTVETLAAGLDPALPLSVSVTPKDGAGEAIYLRDYLVAPAQVLLDGNPAQAVLVESILLLPAQAGGAAHVWTVQP